MLDRNHYRDRCTPDVHAETEITAGNNVGNFVAFDMIGASDCFIRPDRNAWVTELILSPAAPTGCGSTIQHPGSASIPTDFVG